MKSISFLFGLLLLSATILVACTSNSLMRSSEKQQIVEHVKTVEEGIKGLNYQTHEGKVIGYPIVIVLSGVGKV